jgi:hypothetical protein
MFSSSTLLGLQRTRGKSELLLKLAVRLSKANRKTARMIRRGKMSTRPTSVVAR